jgi:hypothetical protein
MFVEERLLIRRAGGGFLFIHRLLSEHFADGDPANPISSDHDLDERSGSDAWLTADWPSALEVSHNNRKINAVTFSPDGRWFATASSDRTARIWDSSTGAQRIEVSPNRKVDPRVYGVAFSLDGRLLPRAENTTPRLGPSHFVTVAVPAVQERVVIGSSSS